MAATATAPDTRALAICDECREQVLRVFTTAQRPVTLDAEAVPGGLYRIDRHGRAERRSLVLLYAEARADERTPGYDPHECRPQSWWARD